MKNQNQAAAAGMAAERPSVWDGFRKKWKKNPLYSTCAVLLVMIIAQTIALGFDFPTFGDWFANWSKNWINLLRNNASVGIVALGMTFVIISGGIDLSVGSMLVADGAILMVLINSNENGLLTSRGISGVPAFAIGILATLAMGAALGYVNGFLIARGRIPPFIVTLGTMKICRSVTQNYMQTAGTRVPKEFRAITNTTIGGEIILPIIYWLVIAVLLMIMAKKTPFGRHIFAIGSNERASRLSGIHVERVKTGVYVLSGLMVAVATIINVGRIGSMDYASAGSGYEMDAIAAVVVGGTSMSGGRGTVVGTVLGMLIIAVMDNLLNLVHVTPFLREAFKGLIVIVAVLLQKKDRVS